MPRKLDWERLKATERGRRGEESAPRRPHADRPPYRGAFSRPPKPARTAWLRRCHAHVDPPDPLHPYFVVRSDRTAAFLGAGRSIAHAIWNAMHRTRSRTMTHRD